MPRQAVRRRRVVSTRTIGLLRALGWRYSVSREAWVHRLGNGALGPVFVESDMVLSDGVVDDHLYQALTNRRARIVVLPEDQREPLPRRGAANDADTDEPNSAELDRPVTPVEVSLRPDEPPRVVHVDGRPPVRGTDPGLLAARDGVVVPIRRRATA